MVHGLVKIYTWKGGNGQITVCLTLDPLTCHGQVDEFQMVNTNSQWWRSNINMVKKLQKGIISTRSQRICSGKSPIYCCCLLTRANNYCGTWQTIGMNGVDSIYKGEIICSLVYYEWKRSCRFGTMVSIIDANSGDYRKLIYTSSNIVR